MTAPLRILLVQPDLADVDKVERTLEMANAAASMIHVPTLDAAVASVADWPPDAVLLDPRLPDGEGPACVEVLRGTAPDIPIVIVFEEEDLDMAYACIAAGAQDAIRLQTIEPAMLRRSIDYSIAQAAARREAERCRRLLTTIVENASDGIVSFDRNGTIASWNRGAAAIFGYAAEDAIGVDARRIVLAPPDKQEEQSQLLQRASRGMFEAADLVERLRRDGSRVALSVAAFPLPDVEGMEGSFCAVFRDVTELHAQSEVLARQNKQLRRRDRQMRALAARLDAVREEEGKRIAREVHDELGQLLTGLKMDIRWVGRRLDEPLLIERIGECDALIDRIILAVQRIATELRPSVLDAFGLQAAIREEARRFEARTAVTVMLSIDDGDAVPANIATAFFRIFQQILTNVVRHADATTVSVHFATKRDDDGGGIKGGTEGRASWVLDVRDDGIGFVEDPQAPGPSLGLLGMRERAAALGGSVRIESAPGQGTRVLVTIAKPQEQPAR